MPSKLLSSLANSTSLEYNTIEQSTNLDNKKSAPSTVQVTRNITTTKGVQVTMVFVAESNPQIRSNIANLLISAFEDRRSKDETSNLPVQSIDKKSGQSAGRHSTATP